MKANIYDFTATALSGEEINLDQYKGQYLLIVNTASECGFTPQLEGLEQLYQRYKENGFQLLAFPCNQFGQQEPGDSDSIRTCLVRYGATFPVFEKINVNGQNAHPIFKFLKKRARNLVGGMVLWNFTKFLVHRDGRTVKRFSPWTKPSTIHQYVENLMISSGAESKT